MYHVLHLISQWKVSCFREAAAGPRRRKLQGYTYDDLDALSDDLPPITNDDFRLAITNTRPTVSADVVKKHDDWQMKFGSS